MRGKVNVWTGAHRASFRHRRGVETGKVDEGMRRDGAESFVANGSAPRRSPSRLA